MRGNLALVIAVSLAACGTEFIDVRQGDAPSVRLPDSGIPEPADPLFRLGQMLFFDRELSGNRNIACATCHVPFSSTTENLPLSIGEGGTGTGPTRIADEGAVLSRNTSTLFAAAETGALFWDGRIETMPDGTVRSPLDLPPRMGSAMDALVLVPIFDRDEMRGQPGDVAFDRRRNELADLDRPEDVADAVLRRVLALVGYQELFQEAFPGETPTFDHLARAIVHFQLELWDREDSLFDRARSGLDRMDPVASVGQVLFFGDAGCGRCHSGRDLGGDSFHNIGVPQLGPGRESGLDEGRFEVTGDPADRFAFRTPPLRNVRLTGPWMHNGAYDDLEAAVRHHLDPERALALYDGATLPESLRATVRTDPETRAAILSTLSDQVRPLRRLESQEVGAIMAFLRALDGTSELLRTPSTAVPDEVPSGLPVDRWPGGPHPFR